MTDVNLPIVMTRKQAKALGLTKYFNGKPCKHGHLSYRYISGGCEICSPIKGRNIYSRSRRSNLARRIKHRIKHLLGAVKARAKLKCIEFSLVESDIKIPVKCPSCKVNIRFAYEGRQPDNTPSLDRIDNTRGYVPDNIDVICYRCNHLKSDADIQELENIVAYMKGHAESKEKKINLNINLQSLTGILS